MAGGLAGSCLRCSLCPQATLLGWENRLDQPFCLLPPCLLLTAVPQGYV